MQKNRLKRLPLQTLRLRTSTQRAFTLIEVVLALGILGFMLSIGWGALRNVSESRRLLTERQDLELIGHAVLTRLVHELQLATKSVALMPPASSPSTRYGANDNFLAEAGNGQGEFSLTFLALEGGQYLPDGGRHSGVVQISYRIVPTPPEEGRRPGSLSLIRSEMPYVRPFSKAYEQEIVFPISHDIAAASFEFYDGQKSQWSKSWTPGNNTELPFLVRLTITVKTKNGDRAKTYSTEVFPLSSS